MNDHTNDEQPQSSDSRREFLKIAGTAAAAVAASSAIGTVKAASSGAKSAKYSINPPRVIGANDRINIGHIGLGGQGNAHLHTLHDHMDQGNHQSVAVCDLYQRRLEGAHQFIGSPAGKAYKNYGDLLSDKDVDVVWIATPEHWHARMAMDAIGAKKDVYLEKPMTRHFDEAIALYKTVKASDRIVQIGSQGCTDEKWHVAGQAVRDGKIGHIIWSQGSYCRNSKDGEWNYGIDKGASPTGTGVDHIDWAEWLGPAPKRDWDPERFFRWRKFWDYSTGILSDLFPHRLHPLMVALGGPAWPTRAGCTGGIYEHHDREVADTTFLSVDFEPGPQSPSGYTILLAGSTENQVGLQDIIRGHKASLYFGGSGVEIRPEQPYSDEVDQQTLPVGGPGEDIWAHEHNFLECVRSRKQPNCPVDLAAPVQVALCMGEIAYKQNKQVRFDSKTMKLIM